MEGGVCGRGACVVQGGGAYVARTCMAGGSAIAADGTHPTGMHSCLASISLAYDTVTNLSSHHSIDDVTILCRILLFKQKLKHYLSFP